MTTITSPISRSPVPLLADIPEDIRARILGVQGKSDFMPNVFLVLSHRSDECRTLFAYHGALMLREGSSLTKGEREMIVVATSAVNQCLYCMVAHGATLRAYEKNPLAANQVAVNCRKVNIMPRRCAMFDFAMKACTASHTVNDADYEALYVHGLGDEDIWDIAGITAFFDLSNRMVNVISMRSNEEFFLLGRLPRERKAQPSVASWVWRYIKTVSYCSWLAADDSTCNGIGLPTKSPSIARC